MTILQIEVATREAITERILAAAKPGEPQPPSYRFEAEADLLSTLNPNRWAILKALTGAGPLGVRELDRRVGRDVKGVHTDAKLLVRCGLVDKTEDGRLHLPYDEVRLALVARAA
jgi:predicted transcriptional regulator